jgi:hypothetical protein
MPFRIFADEEPLVKAIGPKIWNSTSNNVLRVALFSVDAYLHYYEIVKYSSILTGLLKICNSSEIDHI